MSALDTLDRIDPAAIGANIGSGIETVLGTVSSAFDTVTETMAEEIVPAARTGATRSVRVVQRHPRVGLAVLAAVATLAVVFWWSRRRHDEEATYGHTSAPLRATDTGHAA
jgi:hypothetical protein